MVNDNQQLPKEISQEMLKKIVTNLFNGRPLVLKNIAEKTDALL